MKDSSSDTIYSQSGTGSYTLSPVEGYNPLFRVGRNGILLSHTSQSSCRLLMVMMRMSWIDSKRFIHASTPSSCLESQTLFLPLLPMAIALCTTVHPDHIQISKGPDAEWEWKRKIEGSCTALNFTMKWHCFTFATHNLLPYIRIFYSICNLRRWNFWRSFCFNGTRAASRHVSLIRCITHIAMQNQHQHRINTQQHLWVWQEDPALVYQRMRCGDQTRNWH